MKVLITGATAAQTSPRVGERSPTFATLLKFILECDGHSVFWLRKPSVTMTKEELDEYDVILVGLAPTTSITAHHLYGSLSIIELAKELGKLRLFMDAPEPQKIYASYRDILNNPRNLIKEFYGNRREYGYAIQEDTFKSLYSTVEGLYTSSWQDVLVPAFPWSRPEYISDKVPNINPERVNLLCMDSVMFLLGTMVEEPEGGLYWLVDDQTTKWSRNMRNTLSCEVKHLKIQTWDTHLSVIDKISQAVGVLVSVYKDNDPWWSIALSQALFAQVPVVTDWRSSGVLGMEWVVLGSSIEDMTEQQRLNLAIRQKEIYLDAIPSWEKTVNNVVDAVFSVKTQ
jgi:hypothetical protein